MKNLLINCSVAAVLFIACKNPKTEPLQVKDLTFNEITHKNCDADTNQQYEVYLPKTKTVGKFPVIYVFDPQGAGKFAVSHFKEAAELYGYIIIGSDNSKNGVSGLDHILKTLLNDVAQNYPINTERQYAAGFSGGGRVAGMLASNYPSIKGIITCGAGFTPHEATSVFDVFAIAGKEDFNYNEVVTARLQLNNLSWEHAASYFDGGHTWPSNQLINEAVLWFQLNAMRKQQIPVDNNLIETQLDIFILNADSMIKKQHMLAAETECTKGISFFNSLIKTQKLENKLNEIRETETYKLEKEKAEQIFKLEQKLRDGYIHAITVNDMAWWKNEIEVLNQNIKQEKNFATFQMLKRIKGFLGIVCFSFASRAANENDIDALKKLVGIYELIEPQNSDCYFYKAVLASKTNKLQEAKGYYKKALELGFKDITKAKFLLNIKVLSE